MSCHDSPNKVSYKKGEYGYDLEFLKKDHKVIELVNGDARLILVPEYQGRVMTSSSSGLKGFSYGWINHDLISSLTIQEHFNPYGGEERLWLGPEGGQFSIFFKNDTTFGNKNWVVPPAFDRETFDLQSQNAQNATFTKNADLENNSGTAFHVKITRKVTLLSSCEIRDFLGADFDKSVHVVAYQSENRLKNTGDNCWDKENGALSIWMLGMLNASPGVVVILPYKKGDWGRIVKDDYFVKVPESRLKITENAVLFLADGNFRSKIGISPQRTIPRIGSYDAKNNILTILEFSFPENKSDYVNSALEIQKEPFSGDVINSYNDGPNDNGTRMGKFYELESSSPAAFLKPGEELIHVQRVCHFEGSENKLNILVKSFLNVSISEIKKFK